MSWIIKGDTNPYSSNGNWFYTADEDDYDSIEEVKEEYPNDEVRETEIDYYDLCDYSQEELEEEFNKSGPGYQP